VSSTGQACCGVHRRERFETVPHSQDCLPDRQVKSTTGALHLGIFEQPEKQDFFEQPVES